MEKRMIEKIDAVLDRVKEPESRLSIAQLGLVSKLRYSEKKRTLYVFTRGVKSSHHCCSMVIQGLLLSGTIKHLTEEFEKEFPDLSIEFV